MSVLNKCSLMVEMVGKMVGEWQQAWGEDSTETGEPRDTSVVGGRVGIRRRGRSYDQGGAQGDGWRGWTQGPVVTERWGRAWGVMGR